MLKVFLKMRFFFYSFTHTSKPYVLMRQRQPLSRLSHFSFQSRGLSRSLEASLEQHDSVCPLWSWHTDQLHLRLLLCLGVIYYHTSQLHEDITNERQHLGTGTWWFILTWQVPVVAVVFGDESLISRNLDWNLKARDKCQWGIAPSIPADKWPVVTKRWFYVFWV